MDQDKVDFGQAGRYLSMRMLYDDSYLISFSGSIST
jgi:hypothetical protein